MHLCQSILTLRKGTMYFMKHSKLPFTIDLQFFADEAASAEPASSLGDASPVEEQSGVNASALSTDGDQLEAEFEALIKGGKFEAPFKKRTQSIIDKRFKSLKALEESAAQSKPIFDLLSAKYGTDPSDTRLLLEKMQGDSFFNPNSEPSVKPDPALRDALLSEKAARLSKKWTAEAEQLKAVFPSFDFKTELKNPAFSSLLKSGMPLRRAYTAVHSDELIQHAVSGTAKKVAEQTLKSIRAQGSRVAENGLHNGSGIIRKTDVSSLSGKDIRSIVRQVENGSRIRL